MASKIIFSKQNSGSKKAIFLDRDGVINQNPQIHDYVKSWKEFKFNQKIFDVLKTAKEKKFKIIVITNQRGIARGIMEESDFIDISKRMTISLKKIGLFVNAIYYCPHEILENCECRKPKPGMLLEAIQDYDLSPKESIMVGDSEDDKKAAKAAGISRVIILKKDLKEKGVVDKIFMS